MSSQWLRNFVSVHPRAAAVLLKFVESQAVISKKGTQANVEWDP